jgi:hypothetical protein
MVEFFIVDLLYNNQKIKRIWRLHVKNNSMLVVGSMIRVNAYAGSGTNTYKPEPEDQWLKVYKHPISA